MANRAEMLFAGAGTIALGLAIRAVNERRYHHPQLIIPYNQLRSVSEDGMLTPIPRRPISVFGLPRIEQPSDIIKFPTKKA